MYILTHEGESIGATRLERGDPAALTVSGAFANMGGAKAIANWIKSVGGEEDEGVVFIDLQKDFALFNQEGKEVKFAEGHLIAVPEEDEVYLDITIISEADYKAHFAEHISAMESDD